MRPVNVGGRRTGSHIALGEGGGYPERIRLHDCGFTGDRRDVGGGDAEVSQVAVRQPHQLVIGLAILAPSPVGGNNPVRHCGASWVRILVDDNQLTAVLRLTR